MKKVLIVGESDNGKLKHYSRELCVKGAQLAKTLGGEACGVMIGKEIDTAAGECGNYGVKKVFVAKNAELEHYVNEAYTSILCALIEKEKPNIILASASGLGKDLLARAAMRLNAGLATDCTQLKVEGENLIARRPIFAGKAQVDVALTGDLQFATSRPNSYPVPQPEGSKAEVVAIDAGPGEARAKVSDVIEAESGMVDLTEADRIVSGGRSLGSADNFQIIRELAAAIGASVGASRAAVDAGYISHDHQVGQTGKTVNPTLYIACGISGAIQHLAGMRTSKVVVAINKDADAPIFQKADYGIVGDLFEVIPALTAAFRELLKR